MEYTIAGFIPVMMASVTGAVIGRLVFGDDPAFIVPNVSMNNLWELLWIALSGLIVALFAAIFIRLQLWFNKQQRHPVGLRMIVAGLITGILALGFPEILGVGYDTIEAAMMGEIGLLLLLSILCAKIIATAASGGLGVPGGVIGPTLFVGAALGSLLGFVIHSIAPDAGSDAGFYVLLGMGAMMAAVINAPLAALITVFELTHNPNIIFPTMLIIVVAVIATRQLFRCEGLFIAQLESNGFSLSLGPIQQTLNRVGVRSVMDTQLQRCFHTQTLAQLQQRLEQKPKWLVLDHPDGEKYLLPATDALAYLEASSQEESISEKDLIDLLEIPGRMGLLKPIDHQASLLEAFHQFSNHKADALYVIRPTTPWLHPVIGIITESHVNEHYQL